MVIGAVIGSAIFLVPSTVLRIHPSPFAALLVVGFAGVLSFFGALAYAELGSRFTTSGGDYLYLKETWGPLWGFLCGWAFFWVTQTGGIAALAVGFAQLLGSLLPVAGVSAKLAAIGLLALLTWLNFLGVRSGATFGNVMNILKLSGLAVMIGAVLQRPQIPNVDWSWPTDWSMAAFAAALVPVLWAYEGWNMLTFIGEEIKDPQRNLPKALAIGLLGVIIVYSLSFWIYFKALNVSEIVRSDRVAADAVLRVLGPVGGTLVTLTMLVALVSSTNACVLTAARVYFAQARDGLFPPIFARLHPGHGTPAVALFGQFLWGAILCWTGSYEVLFSYCTFGAWIFYTMTVLGVIVMRRRHPENPSAFQMPGYPWTPLAFATVGAAFVASTLIQTPGPSLIGLLLICSGIPAYVYLRRRVSQQSTLDSPTQS